MKSRQVLLAGVKSYCKQTGAAVQLEHTVQALSALSGVACGKAKFMRHVCEYTAITQQARQLTAG